MYGTSPPNYNAFSIILFITDNVSKVSVKNRHLQETYRQAGSLRVDTECFNMVYSSIWVANYHRCCNVLSFCLILFGFVYTCVTQAHVTRTVSCYRYDARNKLEDKSLFGVKSSLPYKMSSKERQLEEELDRERYLALQCDDIRVEEQEGGCGHWVWSLGGCLHHSQRCMFTRNLFSSVYTNNAAYFLLRKKAIT